MKLISFPTFNLKNTEHQFINDIDFNIGEFLKKYLIILRINKRKTISK
jgi:hypothetical protein